MVPDNLVTRGPHTISQLFYPTLQTYLAVRSSEFDRIDKSRKEELLQVVHYIGSCESRAKVSKLIFICTHNSRRSHLCQVWAQVAADYFAVPRIETYSGGTEATAFNPRAVAALQRAGLQICAEDTSHVNPIYEVRTYDDAKPQRCFSKVYNESPNPFDDYCAIMTCAQADEACPLVTGCQARIPIRYEDPKIADDTPLEKDLYDERSRQICREMLYLFAHCEI